MDQSWRAAAAQEGVSAFEVELLKKRSASVWKTPRRTEIVVTSVR